MTLRSTGGPGTSRTRLTANLVLALAGVLLVLYLVLAPHGGKAQADEHVPQSAALEARTGVRFSRVAVVGDGGLLTVFYVVLDPEKATAFQADRDHPPCCAASPAPAGRSRASIMRAGHQMRAGQTYYLVYENTGGAIRSGEQATVSYGGSSLRHVPVP